MSERRTPEDQTFDLDEILAQMAAAPLPAVPPALAARILADAQDVQRQFDLQKGAAAKTARAGWRLWLAELRDGLGGWSALAGLSTAMIAGLWIGGSGAEWSRLLPLGAAGYQTDLSPDLTPDLSPEEAADLELLFPAYSTLIEGI